jgi:hypothetical protein
MKKSLFIVILSLILSACSEKTSESISITSTATSVSLTELVPTQTDLPPDFSTPSPTRTTTSASASWKDLPVVPQDVSRRMIEVYQNGLARGRDPHRFSKFGDCQNVPTYFLYNFDTGDYRLGDRYDYLQPTIEQFSGSWQRASLAVKGGMTVAAVQTMYFSDPVDCGKNEPPMACEIRIFNPSLVILSFETWWAGKPAAEYADRLSSVVEYVLSQDVIPILATKADNVEGDESINAAIAQVAAEYEVPLWNFWAATYPLPNHGIEPTDPDQFHLTFARDYFNDPVRMENAWPWRNLTALQAIDAVFYALTNQ